MKKMWRYGVVAVLWVGVIGLLSFVSRTEPMEGKVVEITTTYGVMKFRLYDETPLHRDNFIKLADSNYFDSLLFHRVINEFMIQGGDPDSKGAPEGMELGNGGPGYDIPAEFVPGLYHKKGVLAAAREGDSVNPSRSSSGSQFYIVQGRIFDSLQIRQFEAKRMQQFRIEEYKRYISQPENKPLLLEYVDALNAKDMTRVMEMIDAADSIITPRIQPYAYTEEQIKMYTTIGGTPHLDYAYTVFGEMIEGFEVLDLIAAVKTDAKNRPVRDVVMSVRVVN
jgi:cyclophilin family peptidyl-prolyl cis-trans isomerase